MGMLVNACPRLMPTQHRRVHANAFMVCASLYDAAVLYEDMCCLQQWMHKQQAQNQQQQQQALVPVCGRKRSRDESSVATSTMIVKKARHATTTSVHPQEEHPASLQFALPFLSTQQTSELAYELGKVGDELSWLNAQHTQRVPVHQVFGWQNALWANADRNQVVWKAAKAFQGKPTRQLAAKVWHAMASQAKNEVIYTVSDYARVVRQTDNAKETTTWLEVVVPRRDDICIMRKQLQHFEGIEDTEVATSMQRQCMGLLFKPFLVPVKGRVVGGTTISAVRALNAKQGSASNEVESVVEALPSTILDWEDAFINRPIQ